MPTTLKVIIRKSIGNVPEEYGMMVSDLWKHLVGQRPGQTFWCNPVKDNYFISIIQEGIPAH